MQPHLIHGSLDPNTSAPPNIWVTEAQLMAAAAEHGYGGGVTGIECVCQHYSICSLCSGGELAKCQARVNDPNFWGASHPRQSMDLKISCESASADRCVRHPHIFDDSPVYHALSVHLY